MGFFDKLFGNIFSKKQTDTPPPQSTSVNYLERWEKERKERMQASETHIKGWLLETLQRKGALPFTWESGNDEGFVTIPDSNETEAEKYMGLEEYIILALDIPDAGEFTMTGSGTIYLDGTRVKATYNSSMRTIIDYNEETDEEVYSDAEEESGDVVLFEF